jgi:ATP synthase I chain
MSEQDSFDYDRAVNRIGYLIVVLGAGGAIVAAIWRGWQWGAGFFLGSLLARLNYRWLRRMVEGLGGEATSGPHGAILGLRYLLLGGAGYVIVRFSSISLAAVFTGVFTLTAAVMIEAVIEIVYARK